jgi:hypothetical protein
VDSKSWGAFYHSDLASPYLLLVVPALFLLFLAVARPAVRTPAHAFMGRWALLFSVLTLIDPVANGPVARALGLSGQPRTLWMFTFVLLGDFRVLWPIFADAGRAPDVRAAARRAARFTLLVPATTGVLYAPVYLGWIEAHGQVLWLIYEVCFAALALWLRAQAQRAAVRALALYVFAYYALWASADVLILSGVDLGWALRLLPNQLYYAFTVPFFWWRTRRED